MLDLNNKSHEKAGIPFSTWTINNDAYKGFLNEFSLIYDESFPCKEIELKTKTMNNAWITKGVLK